MEIIRNFFKIFPFNDRFCREGLSLTPKDRELNKPESSGLNHRGTKNTKVFFRGFGVLVVKFQVIKSAFLTQNSKLFPNP